MEVSIRKYFGLEGSAVSSSNSKIERKLPDGHGTPSSFRVRATLGSPYGKTPRSDLALSNGELILDRPSGLAKLSGRPARLVDSSGCLRLFRLRHTMPSAYLYILVVDDDSYSIASLPKRDAGELIATGREQGMEVLEESIPTWMWVSSGLIARRWRSRGAISPDMHAG